jgi:serine phosphatase RsbU (regulator of sigma subunit)
MASLITREGPEPGRVFHLGPDRSLVGRQPDAAIFLESLAVSRQHAEISFEANECYVHDLGSSNGTYVNGKLITGPTRLTPHDTLQIGPYVFSLVQEADSPAESDEPIIRDSVAVRPTNQTLYTNNPAYKLQVVLEIAQQLARTPEKELLGRLLEHLLCLFPQAERGLVLLCEEDDPAQIHVAECMLRDREHERHDPIGFSRTLVRRALAEGMGILSEDVPRDKQMLIQTVLALRVHSLLCVPLICKDGRRLGVIQLDTSRPTATFQRQDLEVLTAIGMQVAVVLDNAALHREVLRDERLRAEIGMAREIQRSFLPMDFPGPEEEFELFARVEPAYEVSGDLYDFFRLSDGRLSFCVADVSGKGLPAALFLVAVRTLYRHLTLTETGPAATLARLDAALAADNPTDKFVTMAHGVYDPRTGDVALAVAGHPAPLLRGVDGRVDRVAVKPALPLGYGEATTGFSEQRLTLQPGETLILFTDGFTEARAARERTMFGTERLASAVGGERTRLPLSQCLQETQAVIRQFIGDSSQQDDLTMLLLRRK